MGTSKVANEIADTTMSMQEPAAPIKYVDKVVTTVTSVLNEAELKINRDMKVAKMVATVIMKQLTVVSIHCDRVVILKLSMKTAEYVEMVSRTQPLIDRDDLKLALAMQQRNHVCSTARKKCTTIQHG